MEHNNNSGKAAEMAVHDTNWDGSVAYNAIESRRQRMR